jgi:hypothetical protein
MMLNPHCKGLGLIIQFPGKKRMLQITNEYECHVLFSLIVSTYNFQTKMMWALEFLSPHPIVLNPQVFMILWRLMRKWHHEWWKTIESFPGQKSYWRKAKNPLEGWNVHEVHLLYVGFIAWQIIGFIDSQIEVERIFNIASICTNLWCLYLGIENLEMLINIYKN